MPTQFFTIWAGRQHTGYVTATGRNSSFTGSLLHSSCRSTRLDCTQAQRYTKHTLPYHQHLSLHKRGLLVLRANTTSFCCVRLLVPLSRPPLCLRGSFFIPYRSSVTLVPTQATPTPAGPWKIPSCIPPPLPSSALRIPPVCTWAAYCTYDSTPLHYIHYTGTSHTPLPPHPSLPPT